MLSRLLAKLTFAPWPWKKPYMEAVKGRHGMEIGGPSKIFRRGNLLPLYDAVGRLDCCNFAAHTLWRNGIVDAANYEFAAGKPAGKEYIREATHLADIADGAYAFVLASHVIEHVADPLKALAEWSRILVDEGTLILVVPHKDGTFDHKRPVTQLNHLIEDFNAVGEDDQTHLEEWLQLTDLERSPEAKPFAAFRERSLKNFENRGMHHHVFDTALTLQMVDRAGLQIISVTPARPHHIVVLTKKTRQVDNTPFLTPRARVYQKSPFRSDRNAGLAVAG